MTDSLHKVGNINTRILLSKEVSDQKLGLRVWRVALVVFVVFMTFINWRSGWVLHHFMWWNTCLIIFAVAYFAGMTRCLILLNIFDVQYRIAFDHAAQQELYRQADKLAEQIKVEQENSTGYTGPYRFGLYCTQDDTDEEAYIPIVPLLDAGVISQRVDDEQEWLVQVTVPKSFEMPDLMRVTRMLIGDPNTHVVGTVVEIFPYTEHYANAAEYHFTVRKSFADYYAEKQEQLNG